MGDLVRDDEGFRATMQDLATTTADDDGDFHNERIPYIGDPVQLHFEDLRPRPGQVEGVYEGDELAGMVDLVAWNPETASYHVHRAVPHGIGKGYPFWLYPGEDA